MRPVQIMDRPIMAPNVCAICGTGHQDREHFVDLGIDSIFNSVDEWNTKHQTEGVIYFCNLCMTSVISSYLQKLFEHINAQKVGVQLAAVKDGTTLKIYTDEIENLRKENDRLHKLLPSYDQLQREIPPVGESTGSELLDNLLGKEDSERAAVIGDNPDSTGDNSQPESSDTGTLGTSDVFDINRGFFATNNP